ncbi:MAG TPA: SCO family protein [Pyrinomonadaceae bacterium]|nr:SCO family protein [Pyrinomonadaceae bacterium]
MKNIMAAFGPHVRSGALACAALACVVFACVAATAQARQKAGRAARTSPAGAKAAKVVNYSCPMHPEVKSKAAGRCPKCGMDLRPVAQVEPDGHADAATKEAAGASPDTSGAGRAAVGTNIPDVELLDQDGRKVRFYTDLVKGKTVAVQFIFTTCTTICPPLGATFARVQKDLGERAGRDVQLISVSVDPATDTPERLKAWGEKFKAGPGWTLVTGAKPQVDELLRALGAASASPSEHTPTVLVGNDAARQWTRAYGLARPATLVKLLEDAAAGRLEQPADSSAKESTR